MNTSMTEYIKDFISNTTKKIVDVEEEVITEVSVSTKNIIIQIGVSKSDFGKIIGKKGRTIEALKIIVLAIKNTKFPGDNRRISLEILEDESTNYLNLNQSKED